MLKVPRTTSLKARKVVFRAYENIDERLSGQPFFTINNKVRAVLDNMNSSHETIEQRGEKRSVSRLSRHS